MKRSGPSKYNRRVSLLSSQDVQDNDTGVITEGAWTAWAENVPAAIMPLSGREFVAAAATQSQITTRIEIPFMEGPTAKMRAQDDAGQVYGIEAVLPDDETGRDHLTLVCTTEVGP